MYRKDFEDVTMKSCTGDIQKQFGELKIEIPSSEFGTQRKSPYIAIAMPPPMTIVAQFVARVGALE